MNQLYSNTTPNVVLSSALGLIQENYMNLDNG